MTALILLCLAAQEPAPAAEPAPPVHLRGQVIARGTREPLAGASISVDGVPAGEAGPDGVFDVEVTPGPHRLQVQHPGFEPQGLPVEAAAGSPTQVVRLMPRQTGERYETVVTPPDERAPSTTLREEELARVPGSFGDPFRTIESLPGVSQVVWPLAIYAVRGANPGNTGFFIDGIRVPTLFHFALGPSVIHPYFLDQLDFYPGGYPARYGRFVSGVVAARTTAPATDRVHASADVRLFDAGGIVATPWNGGRGTVVVAGRLSYTGLLFSAFSPDYRMTYWDYQVRADHRAGPGRVTVFAFGSGDLVGQKKEQTDADLSFHRVDLRWDGTVGGGRGEAALLLGREHTATSIEQLVALPIAVTTLTAAPRLHYLRPLAAWADLELGGDVELQRFRPTSQLPDEDKQDLFRARDATSAGGYLGLILRAGSRLAVSPALRADAFWEQGTRRFEPGPRLSARLRPAGNVWLKGAVGRYAQMASLPVSVPGFEGFGLEDYGTQTSTQGSFGVEAPLGEAMSAEVTGFYQFLNLTDLESIFDFELQRRAVLSKRLGQSYGVELMLRRAITKRFHGWLAYTLSRSERVVGKYQIRVPSDWDQRHILNLVLGYRLRGGYTLGTRAHYHSGRSYPVFDEGNGRVDYLRMPAFHQLDLRAEKRFVFDRFVLDLYLELVNATLTRQVYDLKRKSDGTLRDRGYRIVLPSIGIHAEW